MRLIGLLLSLNMFFLHINGFMTSFCRVQLDKQNRAKITDLGFCKPEAMMSGSIVGTPIHMAPELFTGALHFTTGVCSPLIVSSFRTAFFLPGKYDNSVDVYAFGILFWYLCAGSVKLPEAFEKCSSKDQLWNNVKKGEGRWRLRGFALQLVCRPMTAAVPPSRSPARAAALLRRGVLAADGGLLERRPFPEAPAWNRGAQPAKHHGPSVLRLGAEEQQPRGLQLNPLPLPPSATNTV